MVTSTKVPDKKVVKMDEHNSTVVVPQRTLLGEVNEHITCPLCRGYYIDATTIVECLHSFCRSCIIKHLQVKSYCPVCEMMINSAKPNIKLDKALQDIVYKLVPGLFQKEMERRQQFYSSRPGPAATATPEQRGEDTERIIFSPEDVISFSLEYVDATDTDSISSKSSDSNEPQLTTASARRYLQCPAVVNISHLKKFLSMKFDIDNSQFAVDILYKRVPLPDYYTLMDIAYIYNWKRNEPMRFFYQIIDYIAIRNRLFDINRKGSHYQDRKSSPASTEDTNLSSPAPNLNDHGSEASSGTDSPMPPGDNTSKQPSDTCEISVKSELKIKISSPQESGNKCSTSPKNEDVEKSQFLNSFELTAKSSSMSLKHSPTKSNLAETVAVTESDFSQQKNVTPPKSEDILKRKHNTPPGIHEVKKLKIEIEKSKLPHKSTVESTFVFNESNENTSKLKEGESLSKNVQYLQTPHFTSSTSTPSVPVIDTSQPSPTLKQSCESPGPKRPSIQTALSPKRKTIDSPSVMQASPVKKTLFPAKQVPKQDLPAPSVSKPPDVHKPSLKKIPDLKPSIPSTQNKIQPVSKVRMDLLANNSDPTIDRSKIMSQVKSSLGVQNTPHQASGHPLKSLLDSCKINIPSSLSITLTDQKQEPLNTAELGNVDQKKNLVNKNLATSVGLKVPSPPVHNYIEILKLPDNDAKKQNKPDNNPESKSTAPTKTETTASQQKPNKSSESSAKGPVPNLKPIADTKLGKQSGNFVAPITFQQTFEQQLQSLQTEKKPKVPRNKQQVPKLVPATPKSFSAPINVNNVIPIKPKPSGITSIIENKPSTALDLSTPHNIQSQLSPQQSKNFETMQSIANLAKKQNLPTKSIPQTLSPSFPSRPLSSGPLRIPSAANISQAKLDKSNPNSLHSNNIRQEIPLKTNSFKPASNPSPTIASPHYQISSLHSPTSAQPSPSAQTRSPSSSPKLVIAEEKQVTNFSEANINQSNQITSTQLTNANVPKNEPPKPSPGPSKPGLKPMKPITSSKISGIRQPITPTIKSNPTPTDIQLITARRQALLRHQIEVSAWLKAQRQFDVYRNIAHQTQNDFKDK